ncbi:MAG TPA: GIY-YIG nuclease family protein [Xanthomonadales bacterium]|nr:GIY-YIG nuclease family protein [Xanthomonadales bacterium]
MTFWAYMLRCRDGSFYVGHTDGIERRLQEHDDGCVDSYTRERRPVSLAWSQEFATREEAKIAEAQLKGWSRAKKQALVDGRWDVIRALAKGRHKHERIG